MTGKKYTANRIEVGDKSNGDYSEIREDGTRRVYGDGTAWKDMIGDLFGKRLLSTAGKVDYDYDENAIVFASGGSITNQNDRVGANLEINHEMLIGTNIEFHPHIHWWQEVSSGAVDSFVFTARYRLQKNGEAKTTAWTTITAEAGTTDDIFDFTGEADGLYNQLTKFDAITITCGLSDTIQFQLTRTDSEVGTVSVYFFDIHGKVDSDGSDEEISKT